MWYPGKAALRAGYVNGAQWNDGFIGDYSLATGYNTAASGANATAMGWNTTASGSFSTALGYATTASGRYSTAMGFFTTVDGDYSTAIGRRAKIALAHSGTFLIADATDADFSSAAGNEFAVRAFGGVRIYTSAGLTSGVTLTSGSGSWSSVSDRHAKENFASVDPRSVLDKLADLPIETWNYKTQDPAIRHMGPMAQDFRAAFGLGVDDKTITSIDSDGTAELARLQARMQVPQGQIAAAASHGQVALGR